MIYLLLFFIVAGCTAAKPGHLYTKMCDPDVQECFAIDREMLERFIAVIDLSEELDQRLRACQKKGKSDGVLAHSGPDH